MRTTCLMGQAAGTAAAVCVEKGVLPRAAGRLYIKDIQQRLLKDGAYIMGQKNEDPADLALRASVTASSVKTIDDPRRTFPRSQTPLIHDLNMQRAVMFKPGLDRIDRIALCLKSSNESATPVTLTLRSAEAFGDFSSETNLAAASATVPPKSKGWVTFNLRQSVDAGKYYYVVLPSTKGLQWELFPVLVENTCRAYGGPNWTPREECYKFRLWPGDEPKVPDTATITLSPENANDGFNRAVNGVAHSWGPDPSEPLPQWVELKFDKPRQFNTVHVTFQTLSLSCRDYSIDVPDGDAWRSVVTVRGNRCRRLVHTFKHVVSDRARLVLKGNAVGMEHDSAQVCEIRVYNELSAGR